MADFCKKCSIEIFGHDFGDLAGICSEDSHAWVICEGCEGHVRWPYVLVDSKGERATELEEELAKLENMGEQK